MTNSFELPTEPTFVAEDGLELKPLTTICPYCGERLVINRGYSGLAYLCLKCKKDVTEKVNQMSNANAEEVAAFTTATSGFPRELQRFSWAAFFFNWIWAFARGIWGLGILMFMAPFLPSLAVVVFFPLVLVFVPACWALYIWFGFSANRLDWERNRYFDAHEFRLSHRRWEVFMKVFGVFLLIVVPMAILIIVYISQINEIAPR